jgi:fluoride exporter
LPWTTLGVNLFGSFAAGFLISCGGKGRLSEEWRAASVAGFCGGFTTFSFVSWHSVAIAGAGDLGRAAAYLAATLVGAVAAAWSGRALARLAFPS